MKQQKRSRPTYEQARIIKLIALKGPLIKTYDSDRNATMFGLAGGGTVAEPTASVLIRRGWIVPRRDGLYDFDAQTYIVPPAPQA